jgi:hypothetical protein
MAAKRMHCRPVTNLPDSAQLPMTSLDLKLNAIIEITDRLLLSQRQVSWKVFFPPDYDGGTTTTTRTTGTTANPFF